MNRFVLGLACALSLAPYSARASDGIQFRGINYAGAEFGNRQGKLHTNYTYPSSGQLSYFLDKGFNVVRLPFKWERLQPQLFGPLSETELTQIRAVARTASAKNAYLVIDPHNYARYDGKLVGTAEIPAAALADFWKRVAIVFANDPYIIFGLMNEPHGLSAESWRGIAQQSIQAIRETGARNLVLVPGVAWTGAHSWFKSGNAAALAQITDPANNVAFEVHQYLDSDFSGTKDTCPNPEAGQNALRAVATWLQDGNRRGFLGEFGAAGNADCLRGLDLMLSEMEAQPNLWLGWTYWAAGHWWPPTYPLSIQPVNGEDRPQMDVLLQHLD